MCAYVEHALQRVMALIVLAIIGLLACVFLVFVLVQWMRDTKRKTKTHSNADSNVGETHEQKQPHVVGSLRAGERRDPFKSAAYRMSRISRRSSTRKSGYSERMAYERITRSWISGKRS
jgi:ABC-type nickel/cobalt efflux system permease component RcnA